MCFRITDSVRYATKPIKVYKCLKAKDGKYISPVMQYNWKIGKLEKADFSFPSYMVAPGDGKKEHLDENKIYSPSYFSFYPEGVRLIKDIIKTIFIEEGLHSYIFLPEKKYNSYYNVVAECEIPKHSWYYINDEGECVSDQLIIKKIL